MVWNIMLHACQFCKCQRLYIGYNFHEVFFICCTLMVFATLLLQIHERKLRPVSCLIWLSLKTSCLYYCILVQHLKTYILCAYGKFVVY